VTRAKKPPRAWYARGLDIVRCGPFDTYDEALASIRLVPRADRRVFPDNAFVWSEPKEKKR
jgi:hypothetical protein